ncbi:MAG TPA: hypothetical protein VIJ78_04085 [Pseudolabrys sp.]
MATKSEGRTEPTMIRMKPSIKAMAVKRAAQESRSLANYVEWLIERDAKSK